MKIVQNISIGSLEVKNSKFISYLFPLEFFEEEMKRLKQEHPKAVHWVSAYRKINEYDQILEHSSDDGEPKGTSGKPTLAVLQGHALINCAIITVRYFGGTKLGPGGLVRAYADAANAACDAAAFELYEKLHRDKISCPYPNISIVEYDSLQCEIKIVTKEFDAQGGVFVIEGTEENLSKFYEKVGRQVNKTD